MRINAGIIDPNLSQGVMTKGYNAYIDRGNALVQQERANKLAELQYQSVVDAENQRRAERAFFANKNPNDPDFEQGLGMIVGPQGVAEYKTKQAGAKKADVEYRMKRDDFLSQLKRNLSSNPSDANVISWGEDAVIQGLYSAEEAAANTRELLELPPEERVRLLSLSGATAEQRKPNTIQINQGGQTTVAQVPAGGGAPKNVGVYANVLSEKDRADLADKASQRSLAERKFAFEQANPGITVQQTEDGTLVGVNNRTGQAMPITMGGAAPVAPAAAPASNAFSPRLPPTAAPAVTQAILGMPSVLDQRAPVAPVAAAPAAPMAGTPLRGKSTTAATTEGERKAATLLQRLQFSQGQLTQALVDNPNAAKPGVFTSALDVLSTPAANFLTSEDRQRVESAQLDMLDAALTLGTGAAYTKEQLEGYRRAYFPQIGDKPKQIEDKKARLQNVISAAKIAAGKGATLVPDISRTVDNDPLGIRK